MRCLIVDDEPPAHEVIEYYLSKTGGVSLAGKCYNAAEAFSFLHTNNVDVLFLDINMPEIDGFTLLDMLNPRPVVIITTAYTDFALKSFEYNAIDYLHKPIRFERFLIAIEKAKKWVSLQKLSKVEIIHLKIDGANRAIETSEIIYAESYGNYVKIVCRKKVHLALTTTKDIEAILPGTQFIRIHKSFIINIDKMESFTDEHVMIAGKKLPIGKTYKRYFLESAKGKLM